MQFLMMIRFNQVSKRYPGGYDALSQVNFSLNKGEMIFLTGASGAGKSTLLQLIALLDTPSTGHIVVNNQRLDRLKMREIAHYRSNMGITFQTPKLLTDRCVFENVALPLRIQGIPQKTVKQRVHATLDKLGLLAKEKKLPYQLSGGEQQRIAIARAVVHKPPLVLADEPTGNLDPTQSKDIMTFFEHLNQSGVSIIIATHDLALIASMKHRIVLLKGGRLC
jgi:cell division transport system ATP-binding protein